ncbi:DUF3461 family protein [Granulosicoccus sp.]|jgi:hypothetical protein|nr:DUF3461 family protein [Granulosicoccus sp.]MDB4222261.1 DUF3461 family protein [Granulosicoccus sp.]
MSSNETSNADSFPALAEMGIKRFHEISHYSLRQDGAQKDVLRVNYKRAKGSWLPYSRKYQFGRAVKTVVADGGTARLESSFEISPFLLKAVVELEKLVEQNKLNITGLTEASELKTDLLKELSELQALVKTENITTEVLDAKFESLNKHIEAIS